MIQSRLFLPICLVLVSLMRSAESAELGPDPAQLKTSIERGVDFLKSTQGVDGSWTSPQQPGVTALVVHALILSGVPIDDPAVAAGLKHLESHIKSDGGVYDAETNHKNYETSIAVIAFQSADVDGRYRRVIDNAVASLKKMQWDEEEGLTRADPAYGGAGYGRSQRPDLSNTTFFLEALRSAGVSSSDPAVQKALIFVSRCQNFPSEHNTTEFASKVDDGGFFYTIAAGGSSVAGKTPEGGLRSYASMTYAGLKSMIYAGLTPDDPRVQAAHKWIKEFYSLDENPGLGQQGLYYYFQTFAKTLDTLGTERFEDASGTQHDWRQELATKLFAQQKQNGSWVNSAERFLEGDPNLVTAYALMVLDYCKAPS